MTVAYDGTQYAGWQRQTKYSAEWKVQRQRRKPSTIQETLERVLSHVLQEQVRVVGSGRTDSGVHALGQVAHVRTRSRLRPAVVQRAANALLPPDIVVKRCARAATTFHARYAAQRKRYRYRLGIGQYPSPFERRHVYHVRAPLDVAAMRRAARTLKGAHDFAPFQAAGGRVDGAKRRVTQVRLARHGEELWFEIAANGFLYKMARRIVGTLLAVGRGQRPASVIRDILETGNASLVGPTAPAHGLALVSVTY